MKYEIWIIWNICTNSCSVVITTKTICLFRKIKKYITYSKLNIPWWILVCFKYCEEMLTWLPESWNSLKELISWPTIFALFISPGHYSKVNIIRYHPCAQGLLTTASYDLDVKLWDINSANELINLKGHPEPVEFCLWFVFTVAHSCLHVYIICN